MPFWEELLKKQAEEQAGPGRESTTWQQYSRPGAPYPEEGTITSRTVPSPFGGPEIDKDVEELIRGAALGSPGLAAVGKIDPTYALRKFTKLYGPEVGEELYKRMGQLPKDFLQNPNVWLHILENPKSFERAYRIAGGKSTKAPMGGGFSQFFQDQSMRFFEELKRTEPKKARFGGRAFVGASKETADPGYATGNVFHELGHIRWADLLEKFPELQKYKRISPESEAIADMFAEYFMKGTKAKGYKPGYPEFSYLHLDPRLKEAVNKMVQSYESPQVGSKIRKVTSAKREVPEGKESLLDVLGIPSKTPREVPLFNPAKGEPKHIKETSMDTAKALRESGYTFNTASMQAISGGIGDVAKIDRQYYSISKGGKRVNDLRELSLKSPEPPAKTGEKGSLLDAVGIPSRTSMPKEASREKIWRTYNELKKETGFPAVDIYELHKRSGVDLEELKTLLKKSSAEGEVVLTAGKYTLGSAAVPPEYASAAIQLKRGPQLDVRIDPEFMMRKAGKTSPAELGKISAKELKGKESLSDILGIPSKTSMPKKEPSISMEDIRQMKAAYRNQESGKVFTSADPGEGHTRFAERLGIKEEGLIRSHNKGLKGPWEISGFDYGMVDKNGKFWSIVDLDRELKSPIKELEGRGSLLDVVGTPSQSKFSSTDRAVHQEKLLNLGMVGEEEARRHIALLSDSELRTLAEANRMKPPKDRKKLEEMILHYAKRAEMNIMHGPSMGSKPTEILPKEAMTGSRDPYSSVKDALMGYGKSPKPFEESKYKYILPVKVSWPDTGDFIMEEMKGLNKSHALERAKRNWPDAIIEVQ